MTSRVVLWVAMVLALAGAVPGVARADWDDRPDPEEFEESLSPNGYWVDDPGYGHVWRPYMDWGWRPYVDGHWIWTSYGWTWASDEPWGWTFHYGRWGFSNLYGWVWTPGYVWGPAWVDWFWGDGYVGWVPLGPPGFVITPSYWTYVRDDSFCSPHVRSVVIVHDRLPRFIVDHREHGWGVRRSPDFRDIEHVSRHRIVREADRPTDSVAPWVRHRIDRGERVRERVADRGGERVIEHDGRQGPDRRGRPEVSDDGWRRRGSAHGDDHGIIERGRDRDGHGPGLGSGGDRAERSVPQVDNADRNRRHDDGGDGLRIEPRRGSGDDHRMGRPDRPDDDRRIIEPRRPADDDRGMGRHRSPDGGGGWERPGRGAAREPDRPAPRAHVMERPAAPPSSEHGGGSMGTGGPSGGRVMEHGGGDRSGGGERSGSGGSRGHDGGRGADPGSR
jgi:hypothetical protein